jgi:hypothetical protein
LVRVYSRVVGNRPDLLAGILIKLLGVKYKKP